MANRLCDVKIVKLDEHRYEVWADNITARELQEIDGINMAYPPLTWGANCHIAHIDPRYDEGEVINAILEVCGAEPPDDPQILRMTIHVNDMLCAESCPFLGEYDFLSAPKYGCTLLGAELSQSPDGVRRHPACIKFAK